MNTATIATNERREDSLRSDENKSPERLEREVDEARARVGRTASELSDRLSPGELLDQALGMASEHAGEFTRNLGAQVKNNPLPMILTSVGITWMMMASGKAQTRAYSYNTSSDKDKHSLRDDLGNAGDGLKDSFGIAAQKTRDKAHEIGDQLHEATDSMKHSAQNARENMVEFYRDQPLIAGSIGIAIGAALGALVPATETEDDMFGHARDRSVDAAKSKAAQAYDEVRDSAMDSL